MSAAVEINGKIARIVLAGALDFSTQTDMREANEMALSSDAVDEIHIDLRDVPFIDSSAVRALLLFRQNAAARGKTLILLNIRETVREVFDIGGFDKVFTIR